MPHVRQSSLKFIAVEVKNGVEVTLAYKDWGTSLWDAGRVPTDLAFVQNATTLRTFPITLLRQGSTLGAQPFMSSYNSYAALKPSSC